MTNLRAAIIGPGNMAGTFDDNIPVKRPPGFWTGPHRHTGMFTAHPINHAAAYSQSPDHDLVGVAGREGARLRAFGERWSIPAFTNAEAMLDALKPDVVSITTQSAHKAEYAILAARTGVQAIIVEKAMATSMAETEAMIAAAEMAGSLLIVNHPMRYSLTMRKGKETIESGVIGQPAVATAMTSSGMIHVGTHTMDLLRYLCGDIEQIGAFGQLDEAWSDRPADGWIRFRNGMTGFFAHNNNVAPLYEVRGDEGFLTLGSIVGETWLVKTRKLDEARKQPLIGTREPFEAPQTVSTTSLLLRETAAALRHGAAMVSTPQDGAAALEAGIAALISAREQRPISLPLTGDYRNLVIPNK